MPILSKKFDPVENIPKDGSTQEEWISWHKALKSNFGAQNANALWIKAWKKYGSPGANTNDLRTYASNQGIEISRDAWQTIYDKGIGITDYFGSFFQVAKYMGIALGVVIIGGIGMAVYNIAKQPGETAGKALGAASKGAFKKGGKV